MTGKALISDETVIWDRICYEALACLLFTSLWFPFPFYIQAKFPFQTSYTERINQTITNPDSALPTPTPQTSHHQPHSKPGYTITDQLLTHPHTHYTRRTQT